MMLVDANVLLDIFTADPVWLGWLRDALARALLTEDTVINPVIYSEVSMAFRRPEELDAELEALGVRKAPLPPMRLLFRPARHPPSATSAGTR